MEITGPFLDETKKLLGRPACWYLHYSASKRHPDGTLVLGENGRPIVQRFRPYYHTKAAALADLSRIREQHDVAGSGQFLFNRQAADDYETALKLAGGVSMHELAKFWRLHHPEKPKRRLRELMETFLADVEVRHGDGAHYRDLKSRGRAFIAAGFGERYADTVTRQEILAYVKSRDCAPRTMRNHKTAVCEFFNWLVQDQFELTANPAAGIKKRMLPKEVKKEIEFLSLDFVTRYLRATERYDPDLVAHEIVQLIAGVRSDDEMAGFDATFVHPQNREVVIPAAV
ncbi:MAG TPA: hypothetical protein VK163_09600, partial [Opitutaceae bacterium]|nr:hypothetical protein [Opitutaceae bacterium]